MGIVARQSIRNCIWSNWGVLIGSVYMFFLVPRAFDQNPAQWGLIQLIIYFNQILLPVALLSIPTTILKFFPGFKAKGKENNLISSSIFLATLAVILISICFILYENFLGNNSVREPLFHKYHLVIIPMLFCSVYFEIFSAWSKVHMQSTVPNFLKDPLLKTWNFLIITLFYLSLIEFHLFLLLYFVIYLLQSILSILYAYKLNKYHLSFSIKNLKNTFLREHYTFMGFTIMGVATYTLMNKIDVLMLSGLAGLEQVSYYSIGLAIVAFIQLPEKSISAISVPTLSHLLNANKIGEINILYKKTSINQLLFSSYIFLAIWLNISNVSDIIGEKFGNIEYVVLFLGTAKLIDVVTGLNGPLIAMSKYYKYAFILQLFLLVLLVISNFIFIPVYGINGAAFASFISLLVYNAVKTYFVYHHYKILPFSFKTILVIIIGGVSYYSIKYLIHADGLWLDLLLKSITFSLLFFLLAIALNASRDFTLQVMTLFNNKMGKGKKQ